MSVTIIDARLKKGDTRTDAIPDGQFFTAGDGALYRKHGTNIVIVGSGYTYLAEPGDLWPLYEPVNVEIRIIE